METLGKLVSSSGPARCVIPTTPDDVGCQKAQQRAGGDAAETEDLKAKHGIIKWNAFKVKFNDVLIVPSSTENILKISAASIRKGPSDKISCCTTSQPFHKYGNDRANKIHRSRAKLGIKRNNNNKRQIATC